MEISEKAEQFVFNLLKDKLSPSYTYHNYAHTQRVVEAAATLANAENITPEQKTALLLAAWFHDTGYIYGAAGHEKKSIGIFDEFAKENAIEERTSSLVKSLILITEMRCQPASLAEQIIRDADCSHFGSPEYESIADQLRVEWEKTEQKKYTDSEWCQGNLDVLTKWHKFYTSHAVNNWQPQKEKNIQSMKEKLGGIEPDNAEKSKDKKKKKEG